LKPVDFEYVRATNIEQAVRVLAEAGGSGKVMAGGQSLVPLLNMRLARPAVIVDINEIESLNKIEIMESEVVIKATVRHRQVEKSPEIEAYVPLLSQAVPLVGHSQIRNRGTVVGSIVHADPSAEIPLVALMLDAKLQMTGPAGDRSVPVSEFYFGYLMTDLQPDEIVTAVIFPKLNRKEGLRYGVSFLEMARREGDFALVSAACQIEIDAVSNIVDIRLGVGGVGAAPIRLVDTEQFLTGKQATEEVFQEAAESIAEMIEPDEDPFVTAEYRKDVAVGLTKRVLRQAWAEASL
jgi:CO/xanthine dehydrogenase FAD-binding subunit